MKKSVKVFLGQIEFNSTNSQFGVFTTGSANCGITYPNIYSVHKISFSPSIAYLVQELRHVGRWKEAPSVDYFSLFVNIIDFAYVMVQSYKNYKNGEKTASKINGNSLGDIAKKTMIEKSTELKSYGKIELLRVMYFLCLNYSYFHRYHVESLLLQLLCTQIIDCQVNNTTTNMSTSSNQKKTTIVNETI